jgi:two-component system, OmpR family, sensor histidine kinase KdpD
LLRSNLEDQVRNTETLANADRFQKTLLDSIAHNVRTPLASIIGSLSTLQEDQAVLDREVRRDLLDTAREEADRLNRLLGNLLDLSRLESGSVRVRADLCDVQDAIGAALEQLGSSTHHRQINIVIEPGLPLIRMDFVLIVQVIANLLDNALKYAPKELPIVIDARTQEQSVSISVCDDGDGIPESGIARVFDKFNRAQRSGETGGIGLGLSICRGLVEAHHGTIFIDRREPRGTTVSFTLPLRLGQNEGTIA